MNKPLVSYCIITYNQKHCIREALDSVVSQDYENMEIIISDDNSKDETFKVIEEYVSNYVGRFQFILNRNLENLNIVGNLNKAIELSHGKYIIFAAGDDTKSETSSVRKFVEYIQQMNVLSLTSNAYIIDDKSTQNGTLFPLSEKNEIFDIQDYLCGNIKSCGAARIIDRKLLEIFDMLNNDCQTEDSTTNLRALLSGGLGYVPIPLVNYRIDGNNVSIGPSILTRFDPRKIFNQYKKDLETAKNKELIDTCTYQVVKKQIEKYLLKETAKRLIYNKNKLLSRLWVVFKLALSMKYPLNDLYTYMKYAILWSKKL